MNCAVSEVTEFKALWDTGADGSVVSNSVVAALGLRANGKDKMVALQAVARHIAITLNTIAKYPDFELKQDPKEAERQTEKRKPGRPRKVK